MTALVPASSFDDVYQLETTDPVTGGPGGVANRQAQALLNRTKFIMDKLAAPLALADGSTAVTPPAFDNDQSVATTAFVKKNGFSMGRCASYSANTVLSAADIGALTIVFGQSAPITLTLPASGGLPDGAVISVFNPGSFPVTLAVATASTDGINVVGGPNVTSIVVKQGESIQMALFQAATAWEMISGSAQLGSSPSFGSSKSSSGYQKLPSGLILQWANVSTASANTNTTWTYPIAFPNAALLVNCQTLNTVGNSYVGIVYGFVANAAQFGSTFPGGAQNFLFAIGY